MPDTVHVVCPNCDATNRVDATRLDQEPSCGVCKQALFTGKPLTLDADNFDRHVTASDLPVLVDFWAPWCGPCKMMAPIIDRAAQELSTSVRVAKVNTESEQTLAARFAIRSIPTLAVFKKGQLLAHRAGALDLGTLLKWLDSTLA